MKHIKISDIDPLSVREKRLVALAVLALIVGILIGIAIPEKQGPMTTRTGEGAVAAMDDQTDKGLTEDAVAPQTSQRGGVESTTEESRRQVVDRLTVFVNRRVGRSPVDRAYIGSLYRASGGDDELTALAVGIAYAETTFGTHPLARGRKTNYMGYDIAHGYDPASQDVFAKRLMAGLARYRGAHKNRALATRYTGGDRVDSWMYAVNEVMVAMGFN